MEFSAEKEAAKRAPYATSGTAVFDVAPKFVDAVKTQLKQATSIQIVGDVETKQSSATEGMTTVRVKVKRKACVGNNKYDVTRAVGMAALKAGVPRLDVDVLDFQRVREDPAP